MDPNLFYLDYERLFEVLVTIVVFSFIIERALAVIFETKWFISMYETSEKRRGLKEVIAVAVSIAACVFWRFDAMSIIIVAHGHMQAPGYILTGLVIAGGAKGAVKLFKDIMGFMSSAEKERLARKKIPAPTGS